MDDIIKWRFNMSLQDFFASHPVFTTNEFDECQNKNVWTKKNTLAYHCKQGRLLSIRRGLYAVIPVGVEPERFAVDPYLLTSRMADDAVLAFHTALELFGKAHSTFEKYTFLSSRTSGLKPVACASSSNRLWETFIPRPPMPVRSRIVAQRYSSL